jgi:hypothetical protein
LATVDSDCTIDRNCCSVHGVDALKITNLKCSLPFLRIRTSQNDERRGAADSAGLKWIDHFGDLEIVNDRLLDNLSENDASIRTIILHRSLDVSFTF